jgi:hypothetical protein
VFDNDDVKFTAFQQHRDDVPPVRIPAIVLRAPRDMHDLPAQYETPRLELFLCAGTVTVSYRHRMRLQD